MYLNKQRLERQTTTFKDTFSLFLMINKYHKNKCIFGLLWFNLPMR
jgi:hypothetical protein